MDEWNEQIAAPLESENSCVRACRIEYVQSSYGCLCNRPKTYFTYMHLYNICTINQES